MNHNVKSAVLTAMALIYDGEGFHTLRLSAPPPMLDSVASFFMDSHKKKERNEERPERKSGNEKQRD